MARLIKTSLILSIGFWLLLVVGKQLAAQQAVEVASAKVRITDLGLESQVPSALDLVGPERGSAGRNRAALVYRLQCWIDGIENCTVADQNHPSVRAIRRFLASSSSDRQGAVVVHFSDQTWVEVRLVRASDLDPNDWDRRVYELVVVPESVQASPADALPTVDSANDRPASKQMERSR